MSDGVPAWYGALTTLLEPIGARWGQRGDAAALRARRAMDVPRADAWIHAASVGEASGVAPLVAEWRRRRPQERLVASAMTPGGRAALGRTADLTVTAPPYDAPAIARRAVRASGLARLVLLETEIWPAWIAAALQAGARVAFVNGRLSDRSWPAYRRIAPLLAPLLGRVTAVAAQTEVDEERWRALGVPAERVRRTGNTKFEALAAVEPPSPGERIEARRRLGLDEGARWCVWGSLRPGEERVLARAMREAPPHWRFLVVPRHPDRWHRSRLAEDGGRARWLLSMGVLADAYRAGDVAVLGGTFARYGGHNPMEPAALGLPVIFGPWMHNVRHPIFALAQGGGAWFADSPARLPAILGEIEGSLAAAGWAARRVAVSMGGASKRSLDWLEACGFWA